MDLARLCRHRADPRGSTGHQSGGDGCGREFLGSSERQTRHVLPQRWLDHPVEWRIQGGRNRVHVRKNRSPGEPDLPWSHKGATLDPGGTYFRVIVIVCVWAGGVSGASGANTGVTHNTNYRLAPFVYQGIGSRLILTNLLPIPW